MFRELMNFSYQRTALQALGWYLIFILFGAMLGGLAGLIFTPASTSFSEGFQRAFPVGQWVALVYPILPATALLWSRWKSALNVFLALAAVLLGLLLGSLVALIPLAVLTTRPRDKTSKDVAGVFD
jgi:hypothetical protein